MSSEGEGEETWSLPLQLHTATKSQGLCLTSSLPQTLALKPVPGSGQSPIDIRDMCKLSESKTRGSLGATKGLGPLEQPVETFPQSFSSPWPSTGEPPKLHKGAFLGAERCTRGLDEPAEVHSI